MLFDWKRNTGLWWRSRSKNKRKLCRCLWYARVLSWRRRKSLGTVSKLLPNLLKKRQNVVNEWTDWKVSNKKVLDKWLLSNILSLLISSSYDNLSNRSGKHANDKWYVPFIKKIFRIKEFNSWSQGKCPPQFSLLIANKLVIRLDNVHNLLFPFLNWLFLRL